MDQALEFVPLILSHLLPIPALHTHPPLSHLLRFYYSSNFPVPFLKYSLSEFLHCFRSDSLLPSLLLQSIQQVILGKDACISLN